MREIPRNKAALLAGVALGVLALGVGGVFLYSKDKGAQSDGSAETLADPETNRMRRVPAMGSAESRLAVLLETISSGTDDLRREEDIQAFLESIQVQEIAQVVETLRAEPGTELKRDLKRRLIRKWALADPKAAAAWVSSKAVEAERKDLLEAVALVWAQSDVAGAVEWVRSLPEGERGSAMLKVAYEAVGTDPVAALQLAREMPPGDDRDELVSHATINWATKNPEEAAKWASQIEDQSLREQSLVGVAQTWGETNPTAAAALALSSLPAGKTQDDALMGIVQRWVQKSPTETAEWVAQFPEGPLRERAAEEVAKLMVDRDVEQAGLWIKSLTPGPSRDLAVSAYIGKISGDFPEQAAQWAESIPDESTRLRELERVAETWLATDEETAKAWIAKSNLPEATKARLTGNSQ